MAKPLRLRNEAQKPFVDRFQTLIRSGKHRKWQVWSDFVTMAACTLAQADLKRREEIGRIYTDTARRYSKAELEEFVQLFSDLVEILEVDPEQDLLGELFMMLELGNEHVGQFFTPYDVCAVMAKMTAEDLKIKIAQKGYVSANDPCCGAGALLIALAHEAKHQGINYQQKILFVAQDLDFTAAMMCFVQLSLLGCAGYVIVGNTLTTPPTEPLKNQNVWYTPMYFHELWRWRRAWRMADDLVQNSSPTKQLRKEIEVARPEQEFTVGAHGQLQLF